MFPRKSKATTAASAAASSVSTASSGDASGSVQRFADVKRDSGSRVKHLKIALESCPLSQDKRSLLEEYSYETFHLVEELLVQADTLAASSNPRAVVEIECGLWVLEQLLCLLPDLISQRWQYFAIFNAFKKCLLPQNVIPLRKITMRLFLIWYQCLGSVGDHNVPAELDDVFTYLLPHFPLRTGEDTEQLLAAVCGSYYNPDGTLKAESSAAGSKDVGDFPPFPTKIRPVTLAAERVVSAKTRLTLLQTYLDKFFEYIGRETLKLCWRSNRSQQQTKCITFLLERLKRCYIPHCFPDLSLVDLYAEEDDEGQLEAIAARPTYVVDDPVIVARYYVIRWIALYSYSYKVLSESLPNNDSRGPLPLVETMKIPPSYETVRKVLFGSRANVRLVVSLIREGLLLPMQCTGVTAKSFRILKEWILQDELPCFVVGPDNVLDTTTVQETLEEPNFMIDCKKAMQSFLYTLVAFYFNPHLISDRDRIQNAFQVNQRILGLLKDLANPQRCGAQLVYSTETWSVYLECILKVVAKIVPPEPAATDSPFALGIATSLFQTLLITWVFVAGVRAVPLSDGLWDQLVRVLKRRRGWPELVDEWTKVLESVTRALAVNCYGIDLHDLPLDRQSEQKRKKRRGEQRETQKDGSPSNNTTQEQLAVAQGSSSRGGAFKRPSQLTNDAQIVSKVTPPQYDFCQHPTISTPVNERLFGPFPTSAPKPSAKILDRSQSLAADINEQPLSAPPFVTDKGDGDSQLKYNFNEEKRESETTSGHSTASSNQQDAVSIPSGEDTNSMDSASLKLFYEDKASSSGGDGTTTSVIDFSSGGGGQSVVFPNDDRDTPSPRHGTSDFDDEFDLSHEGADVDITPREGDFTLTDEAAYGKSWMLVWRRVVGCLGDINEIPNPATHLKAVQTLVRTIESLLKVSINQGVIAPNSDATLPPPSCPFPSAVPPLLWFAPWLLNTADMTVAYTDSKRAAIVALTRIMFHRQRLPVGRKLLARFFAVLRQSLLSETLSLAACSLEASVPALCYDYVGGCEILLDDALYTAERFLRSERIEAAQRSVLFAACLASPAAHGETMNRRAIDLLMEALTTDFSDVGEDSQINASDVRRLAVNGLTVHLLHQLTTGGLEMSGESLQILAELLNCAASEKEDLALLICENLTALVSVASASTKRQVATILGERIIRVYCECLNLLSVNATRQTDELAVRMLLDVSGWCMLLGRREGGDGAIDKNALLLTTDALMRFASCNYRLSVTAVSTVSNLVRRFSQYPLPQFSAAQSGCLEGTECTKTTIQLDSDTVVCGRPDDGTIWTAKPVAAVSTIGFNMAVRNLSGKHCWRADTIEASSIETNGNVNKWLEDVADKQTVEGNGCITIPYHGTRAEPLSELFTHIAASSPECLPRSTFPHMIADTDVPYETEIATAAQSLLLTGAEYSGEPVATDTKKAMNAVGGSAWSALWRRFLADFSLPLWESKNQLSVLNRDAERQLERELSHLDRLFCRECHKVAVIYVAAGQMDKHSILNNQRGSPAFEDFVGRLGWEVDLKSHPGYCGGLPAESSTPYYATSQLEVIFHVSTRLADQEMTKRLKHLGNDEVHIIWSEDERDYRRSIIATEFCDVLIVVYPLRGKTDLLRVAVESRIDVPFGPLFDGAVVGRSTLDALVRATAINAGRAKRRSTQDGNWKRWDEHRGDVIAHMLTSTRKPTQPFSELISTLYNQSRESTC